MSDSDLLETGRRIWCLKRAIGNLCGATRTDDRVPERIITPHEEGEGSDLLKALNPLIRVNAIIAAKIKNERLRASRKGREKRNSSTVEFDRMLEEYYRARRIDENGCPEESLLEELGLEELLEPLRELEPGLWRPDGTTEVIHAR